MMSMSYKENADHLGKGSGINLRSADRRKPGADGAEGGPEAPGPDAHDGDASPR
jgi:hypothetical protein